MVLAILCLLYKFLGIMIPIFWKAFGWVFYLQNIFHFKVQTLIRNIQHKVFNKWIDTVLCSILNSCTQKIDYQKIEVIMNLLIEIRHTWWYFVLHEVKLKSSQPAV